MPRVFLKPNENSENVVGGEFSFRPVLSVFFNTRIVVYFEQDVNM